VEFAADGPEDARAQLERMCSDLLANPLIESVDVTLGDD
jgi:phosphoribosylformylglycinamidine (FGAM) synthase PurS component